MHVDITVPLHTNLITGGPGLKTRSRFVTVGMPVLSDGYIFTLRDMKCDITLYRQLTPDGKYGISLYKDKQSYSTLIHPDFMRTPELFIWGLENAVWDFLPF